MKDRLLYDFTRIFGAGGDIRLFFAPGRVNLIGDHTDYNGGHVFPCALTLGTYAAARRRADDKLRFYSENYPEKGMIEGSLHDLINRPAYSWANYPLGVIWTFIRKGYPVDTGFDLLFSGNIPAGAGLSSSASVEVAAGIMLRSMYGHESLSMQDLAILCQHSENSFNKVNCGIMDQFIVAMGKKDHAVFLDTVALKYEYVPVLLKDCKIIIACSNKKRSLADSKYNERRAECEQALAELRTGSEISSLCDLTVDGFDAYKHLIKDPVRMRRARHAVTENARTVHAVAALNAGDTETFGQLMNESHISLRDDYESTGPELDALAEAAWAQDGVLGSRMTGAGFGGCTVNIVKTGCIEAFVENTGRFYKEKTGLTADFYPVDIGGGARAL